MICSRSVGGFPIAVLYLGALGSNFFGHVLQGGPKAGHNLANLPYMGPQDCGPLPATPCFSRRLFSKFYRAE